MRNPNGYGSIYKLSGNRRKPFIARKTIGWDENVKQLYQTIGYYESRALALVALAEYNKNPFTVEASIITFADLYDKWNKTKFEDISRTAINGYKASFEAVKDLHNIRFVDIRAPHMKDSLKKCGKGYGMLRKIKVLFNQLFEYAMQNDVVSKDYSDFVSIGKNKEESSRAPFTKAEIDRLYSVESKIEWVDTILIMIYTGLRIGELILLDPKNINIEERTMIGGFKTDAGKDRIIPIHKKIIPYIEKRLSEGNDFLIVNNQNKQMKYDNYYREHFLPIMEQLGMKHKPHDCRHTFATLMNNAEANKTSTKKIIGHASFTTTEKTYTHKDIEELKKAIDLLD
ncbi:MAG TPA: site-specific integrase [Ruminiclostridium sp.]